MSDKVDAGTKAVQEHRAQMRRDKIQETRRLAKLKRPIDERMRDRKWPLDARTGQRADIDPEDVAGDLMPEPELSAEQLATRRAEANAAQPFENGNSVDYDLLVSRRNERLREREARNKVQGPEWTEQLVEARIEEAFTTLFRSAAGGRIGPRAFGNAMPAPVREMADLVSQAGNKSLRKAMGRLLRSRGPPSSDEMRRMDDALSWSARYLKDVPRDLPTFLNMGGMWKAWGANVTKKCADLGVHRQTFYRDRKAAVRLVVEGLKKEGKAPT